MLLHSLSFRQKLVSFAKHLNHLPDEECGRRLLLDPRPAVWACLLQPIAVPCKPLIQTLVAIGVATARGEWLVQQFEADLTGQRLAEVCYGILEYACWWLSGPAHGESASICWHCRRWSQRVGAGSVYRCVGVGGCRANTEQDGASRGLEASGASLAVASAESMFRGGREQVGSSLCVQGLEHLGGRGSKRGVWKQTRDEQDRRCGKCGLGGRTASYRQQQERSLGRDLPQTVISEGSEWWMKAASSEGRSRLNLIRRAFFGGTRCGGHSHVPHRRYRFCGECELSNENRKYSDCSTSGDCWTGYLADGGRRV